MLMYHMKRLCKRCCEPIISDENTRIATDFTIKLDFKTSKREGVLVSISHSATSALALELHDGQVEGVWVSIGICLIGVSLTSNCTDW